MIKTGSALSIARQSKLLGVSRSSVYYRPKPESQQERDLLNRLDEIFTAHPIYGSRRLQVMLKREGTQCGLRRIRRLMKKLGLWAIGPKPNTSKPHPEHNRPASAPQATRMAVRFGAKRFLPLSRHPHSGDTPATLSTMPPRCGFFPEKGLRRHLAIYGPPACLLVFRDDAS